MIEEAAAVLDAITGRKVTVVFHNDCDGMCSGAQLVKFLQSKNQVNWFSTRGGPDISDELMEDILKTAPDVVVTVDFARDLDRSARTLSEKGMKCIMLDHHPPPGYDFPEGIFYANPHLWKTQMPASAFVYDIVREAGRQGDFWVAVLGTIMDYGTDDRQDMVQDAFEQYPDLFEVKEMDTRRLFRTTFARMGHILNATYLWGAHEAAEKGVAALLEVDGPHQFLGAKTENTEAIMEKFEEVDRDLYMCIDDFKENRTREGRVLYHEILSPFPQKSQVATIVSGEVTEDVVIVMQKGKDKMGLSLRNQSGRWDLNQMIQEASVGLKASGGGHSKAAAASASLEDYTEFLRRVIEKINA
jgi:single-stranded DNA-specific DHH superfamily exonuclease